MQRRQADDNQDDPTAAINIKKQQLNAAAINKKQLTMQQHTMPRMRQSSEKNDTKTQPTQMQTRFPNTHAQLRATRESAAAAKSALYFPLRKFVVVVVSVS